MKKIFSILAIAALMAGCSKDDTTAEVAPATFTLTGYSANNTRTDFGKVDTESGVIPFVWSEDDVIWYRGYRSINININPTDKSQATFTFEDNASQAEKYVYYNMTKTDDIFARTANVPAVQYANNSLGANGDFGYAKIDGDVLSFTLSHATSYLWFDITAASFPDGGNATLKSISFDANGTNIAGQWEFDIEKGKFKTDSETGKNVITNGKSEIKLTVDQTIKDIDKILAMVVLPNDLTDKNIKVIYELSVGGVGGVGGTIKTYVQNLTGRNIEAGQTLKITPSNEDGKKNIAELRILDFEGDYWDALIDTKQQDGDLLYNYSGDMYCWADEFTGISHLFNDTYLGNYGYCCFSSGGHAISDYTEPYYYPAILETYLAKYYPDGYNNGWGWQYLQLMTPIGAHSGKNFAVHYGYIDYDDDFQMCWFLPSIEFKNEDEEYIERVIDHIYITNTNYALNQIIHGLSREDIDGDNDGSGGIFGGNYGGPDKDTYLKVVAYGYPAELAAELDEAKDSDQWSNNDINYSPMDYLANEQITSVEFYLVKDGEAVLDWQRWDLSKLGEVAKVKFNFEWSENMDGIYGFTIPAYFAYDDVAVQWEE